MCCKRILKKHIKMDTRLSLLTTKWYCNFYQVSPLNRSLLTIKKNKFTFLHFGWLEKYWIKPMNISAHKSLLIITEKKLFFTNVKWNRRKNICIKHIIGDESLAYLSTLSIVSRLYQRFYNIHTMSCHFHYEPDEFDAWCLIAVHSNWYCW